MMMNLLSASSLPACPTSLLAGAGGRDDASFGVHRPRPNGMAGRVPSERLPPARQRHSGGGRRDDVS